MCLLSITKQRCTRVASIRNTNRWLQISPHQLQGDHVLETERAQLRRCQAQVAEQAAAVKGEARQTRKGVDHRCKVPACGQGIQTRLKCTKPGTHGPYNDKMVWVYCNFWCTSVHCAGQDVSRYWAGGKDDM